MLLHGQLRRSAPEAMSGSSPGPAQQLEAYRIAMFQAHCGLVLTSHLEPWALGLASGNGVWSEGPRDPDLRAVIVDDRPTPLLRMTVLNTLLMGRRRWGVTLYTALASLERSLALVADLGPWVKVVGLRVGKADRLNWLIYNQLLKSAAFWQQLSAAKLLIFQADTLLIEPPDPAVFDYNYVGSPWAKGRFISQEFPRYDHSLEPLSSVWLTRRFCDTVPEGLSNGNGGLSVRDRQLMLQICKAEAGGSPRRSLRIFSLPATWPGMTRTLPLRRCWSASAVKPPTVPVLEPMRPGAIWRRRRWLSFMNATSSM